MCKHIFWAESDSSHLRVKITSQAMKKVRQLKTIFKCTLCLCILLYYILYKLTMGNTKGSLVNVDTHQEKVEDNRHNVEMNESSYQLFSVISISSMAQGAGFIVTLVMIVACLGLCGCLWKKRRSLYRSFLCTEICRTFCFCFSHPGSKAPSRRNSHEIDLEMGLPNHDPAQASQPAPLVTSNDSTVNQVLADLRTAVDKYKYEEKFGMPLHVARGRGTKQQKQRRRLEQFSPSAPGTGTSEVSSIPLKTRPATPPNSVASVAFKTRFSAPRPLSPNNPRVVAAGPQLDLFTIPDVMNLDRTFTLEYGTNGQEVNVYWDCNFCAMERRMHPATRLVKGSLDTAYSRQDMLRKLRSLEHSPGCNYFAADTYGWSKSDSSASLSDQDCY